MASIVPDLRSPVPRIAIIGTGIAGLSCGRALVSKARYAVTFFEKSSAPGGRVATRQTEEGLQFDHGAPYFSAHDERFLRQLDAWREENLVEEWTGRLAAIAERRILDPASDRGGRRFVGVPSMNSIGRRMAEGLEIRYGKQVSGVAMSEDVLLPLDEQGAELGEFDAAVIAVPAVQAGALLRGSPRLAGIAGGVPMSPCWAVMAALPEALPVRFDGAFIYDGALVWAARDSSKPQRRVSPETWVLHATPAWSRTHLEENPESVAQRLLAAFAAAAAIRVPEPLYLSAHRWRYALPAAPLGEACLFDPQARLGACGDWCCGPGIEHAFLSGLAMADRLVDRF